MPVAAKLRGDSALQDPVSAEPETTKVRQDEIELRTSHRKGNFRGERRESKVYRIGNSTESETNEVAITAGRIWSSSFDASRIA